MIYYRTEKKRAQCVQRILLRIGREVNLNTLIADIILKSVHRVPCSKNWLWSLFFLLFAAAAVANNGNINARFTI